MTHFEKSEVAALDVSPDKLEVLLLATDVVKDELEGLNFKVFTWIFSKPLYSPAMLFLTCVS